MKPINEERIAYANTVLQKYKDGKANLESRIIESEKWYRLRHWETFDHQTPSAVKPTSAYLFNSLANKHADAMDNYPAPNILPREQSDEESAKVLTSVLPTILKQVNYEQTYSDTWWYKLRTGTGVKGIFWNKNLDGLGNVDIRQIDILNLFWEPGIRDIQESQNLFHVELFDNDILHEQWPKLELETAPTIDVNRYVYDDTVDTTDKSVVVDWYYKKDGVLHFVKYCNGQVLYATENEPEFKDKGLYEHGMYPFVFDVLFPIEGSPAGIGYVDIAKSPQEYVDRLDQAMLENALVCSKVRFLEQNGTDINEEEFLDLSKPIVHINTAPDERHIQQITYRPISGIYETIQERKIQEIKETTGNRDFNQGDTNKGVTSGSAIAALIEVGSKLSRDMIKSTYRAYTLELYQVIELIRQFYTEDRVFRITGENGTYEFKRFNNAQIATQSVGDDFGTGEMIRKPIFDIEVSPEKQSAYSKMSNNDLAIQLYNLGFFNPQLADQALATVSMMDFDKKQKVIDVIQQNGTMYEQLLQMQQQMAQMAQIIDAQNGTTISQGLGQASQPMPGKQGAMLQMPAKSQAQKSAAIAQGASTPR